MRTVAILLALMALCTGAAAQAPPLADHDGWRAYKARFVTEAGRVVDTGNGGISHSEGQGYGMLLAALAGDRATFERIWTWTRANLMVRDDQLLAWRWEPDRRPAVADMNDAADGDLLVAWALAEAVTLWNDPSHRVAGRRIAVELGRKLILPRAAHGPLLLPGVAGFSAEDRPDGPVVNLSYWIFPAFDRMPLLAPEFDWAGLDRSGRRLLRAAGSARPPAERVGLPGGSRAEARRRLRARLRLQRSAHPALPRHGGRDRMPSSTRPSSPSGRGRMPATSPSSTREAARSPPASPRPATAPCRRSPPAPPAARRSRPR